MRDNIGYNLQFISRTKGLRQIQISEAIGINPATLSKFFSGNGNISSNNLIELLNYLKIVDVNKTIGEHLDIALNKHSPCSVGNLVDSVLKVVPSRTRKITLLKSLADLAKSGRNKAEVLELQRALRLKLKKTIKGAEFGN